MAGEAQDQVVDASVVVKWFVPEADTDYALRLRDLHVGGKITLYAPILLIYEVIDALMQRPDITDADLERDVEVLFSAELELVSPSSTLLTRTARRAPELNVSMYDAPYAELASFLGCTMVTADVDLFERAKNTGVVRLLSKQRP